MSLLDRFKTSKQKLPAAISPELQAEIDSPTGFMYGWQLTPDFQVEPMNEELPSVHLTREQLIEPIMRSALKGSGTRAIDLGAHEGYFSQRALDWGAETVLLTDIRDINTDRATLLRNHFGISPQQMPIEQISVYDIDPAKTGLFDAVLCLGLIYHLEDPIGAIRVAAALAKPGAPVLVESQLTQQNEPIRHGHGLEDLFFDEPCSWAARLEPMVEQEGTPLSSFGGVISLIPNRAALFQAMEVAGLENVRVLEPAADHNIQYRRADRSVFVGYKRTA